MGLTNVNNSQSIDLITIRGTMDRNDSETRKSARQKQAMHHEKAISNMDNQINELEKNKKNGFLASIVSVVADVVAMGVNFIPVVGPFVSQGVKMIGNLVTKIFSKKAEDAGLNAKKFERTATQEQSKEEKVKGEINKMQQEQQARNNRIDKSIDNLNKAQEAVVRV